MSDIEVEDVKTITTLFFIINIILYFVINTFKERNDMIKTIDTTLRNYLDDTVFISLMKLSETITIIGLIGVLNYYKEYMYSKSSIFWIFLIYLLFYISNLVYDRNDIKGRVYIIKILNVIYSLFIIFYLGYISVLEKKKVTLTIFMTLLIIQTFYSIWEITDKYKEDYKKDWIVDVRYWIYFTLLFILWGVKVYKDVKIYRIGEYYVTLSLLFYSIWIIGRTKTLISNFQEVILPFILFIVYLIINYKDFNTSSINTKFVYILGFLATVFLLYIIINTEDKKIKAFITIFLVVVYNILAIVYGNKDCNSVSGYKLLKRILKWIFLIVILVLILWKDFFQTSIGDNLITLKDDLVIGENKTDTDILEEKKGKSESKNREEIQERLNTLYETRARRNI